MVNCSPVGLGLHICQSIDDVNCGTNCDKTYYDPDEIIFLHVALNGRPSTIKSRVLNLIVNNTVADSITLDEYVDDFMHMWILDENYMGNLRVDYVENGMRYWSREFGRGICVLPLDVNRVTSERLIFNLMKMRGQI